MPNPWFRMYSEMVDDPKVQMMSEIDQRRWLMILCLRCKEILGTLRETQIAFHLRITPLELAATKVVFIENGFIDEYWNVLNWDRRQYISDSSTERVRRHRQAKKQDETLQPPFGNVVDTDTEQKQNRREEFKLPAWVDPEVWSTYLEVRSAKKAAKTPRAWNAVIKQLNIFRSNGHDPNAILETSIRSNWTDVYEPQQKGNKSNGRSDRAFQTAASLIEEIENCDGPHAGELLSGSGTY